LSRETNKKEFKMPRDNESSSIPYLLIGIGIGVIAGIVLAPESGQEIRRDVRRRANKGFDYLNQQADRVRESAEKAVTTGKEWIARQSEAVHFIKETRKPYHEQI
jgi:gas vesicle protein